MRPCRRAAFAARARAPFEFRGTPRMHERPIGDLVDALRSLGCRSTTSGAPGFPPLGCGRADAAGLRPADRRPRRRLEPVPHLAADRPAAARRCTGVVVEVAGDLISKPYVASRCAFSIASASSSNETAGNAFALAAGGAALAGAFLVEADASSASYFIAAGAIAASGPGLRIEGVGDASIQETRLHRRGALDGRDDRDRADLASPARPLSAGTDHARLQPYARRGDDAGRARPVRRRDLTAETSPAGGSRRPTVAAMASELRKLGADVDEGADTIEITPRRTLARRRDRHLRRPPDGDGDLAGGVQRRGRAARGTGPHPRPALRRQDLARLLRSAFRGRPRQSRRRFRC